MVALNQNRISPPPSHYSASIRRQTPLQNNSKSPTPIRLFLRARYYDPHTAEFTSPDPLEYVDGMSLFRGSLHWSGVDPNGEGVHKLVAKSYISGMIGGVGKHPITSPYYDGLLGAFATSTAAIFREFPTTDVKDKKYRLYTKIEILATCCKDDGNKISSLKIIETDKDAGVEPGNYQGTINLRWDLALTDDKCGVVPWFGWGCPDPGVEWTFDFIHARTSVNIWHKPRVKICCVNGATVASVDELRASNFPSHGLWIDGAFVKQKKQGKFHSLWRWDVNLGPEFVTEDGKGPFTPWPGVHNGYPWWTQYE